MQYDVADKPQDLSMRMTLEEHMRNLLRIADNSPGFALTLMPPGAEICSVACGFAAAGGPAFTSKTPIRTASVTKTIVAAALLRLCEINKLDLDTPASTLIDPNYDQILRDGSFKTDEISVRHLAMHTSGMGDHFASDAYMKRVLDAPSHHWSREEQLKVLTEEFEPLEEPGVCYSYSDSGYILLGHVIEKITGEPLAKAVRHLTKFEQIGLNDCWWDAFEEKPEQSPERAHQYRDGVDTFHLHGSMDAYGGGGLVASTEEMALFFRALFSNRIFENSETLDLMTKAPGHPPDSPYRIGLFHAQINGTDLYSHAGYWGTNVIAVPDQGIVVAGTTLEKQASAALIETMEAIVLDCLD